MLVRRLPEVRAAGDLIWFQPALDRLGALRADADPRLRDFLALDAPLTIARAPGRLDVMGGIADYSGALVLELPLARATWAILQRQAAPRCDVATLREGRWHFFGMDLVPLVSGELQQPEALAAWFAERATDHWAASVAGAVYVCLKRTGAHAAPARGFRLLIDSTVPEGKGVASSAALEVACLAVIADHCGVAMTPEELAAACQWVENHIVGAACGIMDQMTSVCGRQGRLLRLRCQPATIEGHVEVPRGYRFYGIDSGIRHAVSGSDYETVRTAAFMGYRMIAEAVGFAAERVGDLVRIDDPRWRGYLANLTPAMYAANFERILPEQLSGAEFLARYGGITDPVTRVRAERSYPVRQATAHPVFEQERVERFARLLDALIREPQAASALGRLMFESHASYGACGLGSDGTDRLVELVNAAGAARGLYGAKITGGGSGGTVAILGTDQAQAAVREIAVRYREETGRRVEVFTDSGPGAAETGVLLLEPDERRGVTGDPSLRLTALGDIDSGS